jgi:hypothetical protein
MKEAGIKVSLASSAHQEEIKSYRKIADIDDLVEDPFTITDAHSRYLIRCQIVSRMDLSQVLAICEAAMQEYGVPARIRTDNGAPFAGTGYWGCRSLNRLDEARDRA